MQSVNAKSDKWPAFNVERRSAAALKPYKNNARTHSEEQVAQIAASIKEWGFTNPILVDEKGGVIAGHGRLLAAQSLGVDDVPVIIAKGWSKAQKRAYVIADNSLALNAGWDEDLLRVELGALGEIGFDTSLLGFGEDFLADLMADRSEGLTDPDDAPELPVDPVSRLGDLWICGKHRVMCGDATKAEDVARLLGSVKPHLMVTDPPYGVGYDAGWRNKAMPQKNDPSRQRDGQGRAIGQVLNDDRSDWREAWALYPGEVAYCWHAGLHASNTQLAFEACGFQLRSQIIWAKQQFAIGRGHYHVQHEPCFYMVRKGSGGHWVSDRKQTTLWQIDKPQKSETGHSTQKPVECMRRPIVNNSKAGQAVYDPFVGSGTTMIAAEMEGRRAYCMELSEAYVDVVVKRWQAFTGKEATLDGDGRTFEEVSDERGATKKQAATAAKREKHDSKVSEEAALAG